MKQLTNHQKNDNDQIRRNNSESLTESIEKGILLKPITSNSNSFLVQNIGKDPPGRWCSPGDAYFLDPDKRPDSLKSNKRYSIFIFKYLNKYKTLIF